jgi:hypothetical protein
MRKDIIRSFISDLLLGWGVILTISPLLLYWFIHGNYERYVWIINGPYPFSHFGGGPFQLFMYAGLFAGGIGLVAVSMILRRKNKTRN